MKEPVVNDLINLFNRLFKDSLNTVLVKGDDEPIYLPADKENPHHRVIFAHGFYASALHEIAHWCVAGPERRELVDFGYWYKPDGRTAHEQAEFEKVEVRPQAFEWLMSQAAGHKFNFSADNLSSDIGASEDFQQNVLNTVHQLLDTGLPTRVELLVEALTAQNGRGPLSKTEFSR
ncbi:MULTISPECIES: elongation factor P hydroxylase [unclassified Neptuniibacter]|uniref:elongation factor P hydroxylase n=1 Tax=unclassified Neptuniibacter TaxID=2630693 RepID=UPI000C64D0DD|nr:MULTISPECIES: elongation factor P hydroxylase [unclassified Neptuniibacter]MAY43333.1 ATPase [Oceanospirillaceae bacterium]